MSTRIYNGYKLPLMTMGELLEFSKKVKVKADIVKTKEYHKTFANIVYTTIDNFSSGLTDFEKYKKNRESQGNNVHIFANVFSDTYWSIYDRIKNVKITRNRDPAIDWESNIVYIPREDCILALFYSENKDIEKVWKSFKEVKYYGYWDNTDHPKNITRKNWEKRGEEWDDALGNLGIPVEAGFTFEITSDKIFSPDVKDILKYIPSFDDRVMRITKEKYITSYIEKNILHLSKEEQNKWSNMSEHYFKALDNIKDSSAKDELDKIKFEIEPLLDKKITKDILFKDILKEKKEEIIETTL